MRCGFVFCLQFYNVLYVELQNGPVFSEHFVCIKIRGTGILNKVKNMIMRNRRNCDAE